MIERAAYLALGAAMAGAAAVWVMSDRSVASIADYKPAQAIHHKDGSITLAKETASDPTKRAAATYPTGSKVIRQIDAVLQPKASGCASIVAHVDLTQSSDGATRATVSADGATVINGMDLVISPAPDRKQWMVGAGVMAGKPSIVAGRSVGPVKILGAVAGTSSSNLTGALWVMVEF